MADLVMCWTLSMVGVRFWRVALRATRKAGGFEGQCCLSTPVLTALQLQLFAVVSEDSLIAGVLGAEMSDTLLSARLEAQ